MIKKSLIPAIISFITIIGLVSVLLVEITIPASASTTELELEEGMQYKYLYQLFGIERNIEIYITTMDDEELWGGIVINKGEDVTTATRFEVNKKNLELYITDPLNPEKILDEEIKGYKLTTAASQSPIGIPLVIVYHKQLYNFDLNELIENRSITVYWQTYLGKKMTEVTLEGPIEYNNYNTYKITIEETNEIIYFSTVEPYLLIDHYISSSKIVRLTELGKKTFDANEYNITIYPNHRPEGEYNYSTDNLKVEFNASDSYDTDGKIISYDWDFGDGNLGTGINPTHEYNVSGNYTVKLTLTDDEESIRTVSKIITLSSSSNEEEDDENGNHDISNGEEDVSTPGFEFILILFSVAMILFLKRKK